jgi:hypothetical protein
MFLNSLPPSGDFAFELCIVRTIPCTIVDPMPVRLSTNKSKQVLRLGVKRMSHDITHLCSPESGVSSSEMVHAESLTRILSLVSATIGPRGIPITEPMLSATNAVRDSPAIKASILAYLDDKVCKLAAPAQIPLAVQLLYSSQFGSLRTEFTTAFPETYPQLWSSITLVVGLHPDQATEAIVDCALRANKPFAVVPCCVFPLLFPERQLSGQPVRSYEQFLDYLQAKHPAIRRHELENTPGCNVVLWWLGSPNNP